MLKNAGAVGEAPQSAPPDRTAEPQTPRDRSPERAPLPTFSSTRLRFRPDEDLSLSRIDVIDRETDRVIRTIPAERAPLGSLLSVIA